MTSLESKYGFNDIFDILLLWLARSDRFNEAGKEPMFLIYAHENEDNNAGAHIPKHILEWLKTLGAPILSDKSPLGTEPDPTDHHQGAVHNILLNQFCLLPKQLVEKRVGTVILCCSETLAKYHSDMEKHFPRFTDEIWRTCSRFYMEPAGRDREGLHKELDSIVENHLVRHRGIFHHILTELALLEFRRETKDNVNVVPIIINGTHEMYKRFPGFEKPTNLWMASEQMSDPDPRPLHHLFFKLLRRLYGEHHQRIDCFHECYKTCVNHTIKGEIAREDIKSLVGVEVDKAFTKVNEKNARDDRKMGKVGSQERIHTPEDDPERTRLPEESEFIGNQAAVRIGCVLESEVYQAMIPQPQDFKTNLLEVCQQIKSKQKWPPWTSPTFQKLLVGFFNKHKIEYHWWDVAWGKGSYEGEENAGSKERFQAEKNFDKAYLTAVAHHYGWLNQSPVINQLFGLYTLEQLLVYISDDQQDAVRIGCVLKSQVDRAMKNPEIFRRELLKLCRLVKHERWPPWTSNRYEKLLHAFFKSQKIDYGWFSWESNPDEEEEDFDKARDDWDFESDMVKAYRIAIAYQHHQFNRFNDINQLFGLYTIQQLLLYTRDVKLPD